MDMNAWLRGDDQPQQRGQRRQSQQQSGQQQPKPEELETEELFEVVGASLKAAAAALTELQRRSKAEDDSADVERQTKEPKPVEEGQRR